MKAKNISILAISLIGLTLPVSGQSRTNSVLIRLPQEARSATVWQKPPGWFEPVPGGWRSVNSPWDVQIASNLFQQAGIVVTALEKVTLKCTPVALSYTDPVTQSNVLIALPKNSAGYLAASNQVIFPDCWEGLPGVACRYTLRHHSFSQDLLIQGELPDPTRYGLKPEGLRIQIWTEFKDTQEPQIKTRVLTSDNRTNSALPIWVDEHLSFGSAAMVAGKAFLQAAPQTTTNRQANLDSRMTPVTKRWVKSGARSFIVEEVDYEKVMKMQRQLKPVKLVSPMPMQKPQSSLGKPFKLPPELPEHAAAVGSAVPSRSVALLMQKESGQISPGMRNNSPSGALKTLTPDVRFLTQNQVVIDWEMTEDSDSDGLSDDWEQYFFGNLNYSGMDDPDNDGLDNAGEFTYSTDPNDSDTDDDGLLDGAEIGYPYYTSPTNPDTDGDALSDGAEANTYGTDPNNSDSDGDGLSDGDEISTYYTIPNDSDSDDDGMPDGWEIQNSFDPNLDDASGNPDDDGLSNLAEYQNGTEPRNADTDGDWLTDGQEVNTYNTNPKNADSDADSLSDYAEIMVHGTNANDDDSDNDDLLDGWELDFGFNPLINDANGDADGDGITNLQEFQIGTNPRFAAGANLVLLDNVLPTNAVIFSDYGDWTEALTNTGYHYTPELPEMHQHGYYSAPPVRVSAGDTLFCDILMMETGSNEVTEVMLQWTSAEEGWVHRAFWGADSWYPGNRPCMMAR